jgi:phospholipid/cholesterol/gamma-HCH transport system substrate-binding protein
MNERNLRIRLGIFVVVTLVLLGALILLFGSLPPLFRNANRYTVDFDDAPGISPGSPVRRSGVRIGEVTGVDLDDENGKVHVEIAVERKYTLRHSEVPTLVTSLLGNDASIDFIPVVVKPPEVLDRTVIAPGARIAGFRQTTVNQLLTRASDVVPTTQDMLNDVRRSLKRIEDLTPLMEETLREYRDLAKETRRALPDAQETVKEVGALARRTREAIPSLERTSDDVGATARAWTQFTERLNLLVAGNQEAVKAIIDNVNVFMGRLNHLVTDENVRTATALLKNLREASDTLPATARNLRSASDDAPALMKNLRESSERLPSIAKNTDEGLQETRAFIKNFNESLGRADDVIRNMQRVTRPLADRGDAIARNLDATLDKLNRNLTDLGDLVRVIGQSDGTLKRLINDPTLYNRLDDVLCGLDKSMPRVDRILKDMETFADKLARHPEKLGLGGVVRPDSGVKDPPASAPPIQVPSFSPKH